MFDIDIEIHRGEVVCVIGPNGAGKTTLLLTLMGALQRRNGIVEFDGRDATKFAPEEMIRAGLSLCPEGRRIFQHMTVEENLHAAVIRGRSLATDAMLDQAFELFPALCEKRRERAGGLSGGQQQMLAIARALVCRPDMLMLDEPSLGLAPKLVSNIFERLLQLQATGTTLLIVDQNVELALDVSDYAYVLEAGEVALAGPARKLVQDKSLIDAFLHAERRPAEDNLRS